MGQGLPWGDMNETDAVAETEGRVEPRLIVLRRHMYVLGLAVGVIATTLGSYIATMPALHLMVGGAVAVAFGIALLAVNAGQAWNPARYAFLRLGETSMECRLGYRKWVVDYRSVGSFYIVSLGAGIFLSWRTREIEERMDPAVLQAAPDPFDNVGDGVGVPRHSLPAGESLERICADLNRLRANAMAKAGLAEIAVGSKRNLPQARPFLAPPAIGREAFAKLLFGFLVAYLVGCVFAFPPLRDAWGEFLLSAQLIQPGTVVPEFLAVVTLVLGFILMASWIVFARLRDIDRGASWGAALYQTYDLIVFNPFSPRTWSRLFDRRGMR
jgi:hypothetical protein